jgi:hypothetical protein
MFLSRIWVERRRCNLDGIDSGMADISIDDKGKEGETLERYPRMKFDVVVEMS